MGTNVVFENGGRTVYDVRDQDATLFTVRDGILRIRRALRPSNRPPENIRWEEINHYQGSRNASLTEGFYECDYVPDEMVQTVYFFWIDHFGQLYEFSTQGELQRAFFANAQGTLTWQSRLKPVQPSLDKRTRRKFESKERTTRLDRIDRDIVEVPEPPPPPTPPKKKLTTTEIDEALAKAVPDPEPQRAQVLDFDLNEFLKTL